jgi:ethanolamine utilization cobalamin adenosyltransferase
MSVFNLRKANDYIKNVGLNSEHILSGASAGGDYSCLNELADKILRVNATFKCNAVFIETASISRTQILTAFCGTKGGNWLPS